MKKNSKVLLFMFFFMLFNTVVNERIFAMEENAFSFTFESIEGQAMPLEQFKGKALLVVNTASLCGFTPQYEGLQSLWDDYKDKGLVIIGVPSNNFGKQEPEGEDKIKEFCET